MISVLSAYEFYVLSGIIESIIDKYTESVGM